MQNWVKISPQNFQNDNAVLHTGRFGFFSFLFLVVTDFFLYLSFVCWWLNTWNISVRQSYFCFLNFVCYYPNFSWVIGNSGKNFLRTTSSVFKCFLSRCSHSAPLIPTPVQRITATTAHVLNRTTVQHLTSTSTQISKSWNLMMESSNCSVSIDRKIWEKILSNTTKPIKKESSRKHSHDGVEVFDVVNQC